MLVKVLGAMDCIEGLILLFGAGIKLPFYISLILGVFLLIKAGMGKLKDIASWIDLIAGIIFILLIFFNVYWLICLIAGILLLQKGVFSFL